MNEPQHDALKDDAYRWACAMGRLSAGLPVNMIWHDHAKVRSDVPETAIAVALRKCGGNRTAAAALLGIPRSTFHLMVKKLAMMAALVLVVGCKTSNIQHPTSNIQSLPPVPTVDTAERMTPRAALVAPAPPAKTITLAWDKNDPHPETLTQVWQSADMNGWQLRSEHALPGCVVAVTNQQQFYKIRNRRGTEYSDWDKKGTPHRYDER